MDSINEGQIPSLTDLLLQSASNLKFSALLGSEARTVIQSEPSKVYLSHLLTLPVEILEREPETLGQSANQLDNDLAALCFRSYQTFLLAHSCSTSISSSFASLNSSLDSLIASSDTLASSCKAFNDKVGTALDQRNRISTVLDQINRVTEILEVPKLVGTCVRGGYWAEAMDLSARIVELDDRVTKSLTSEGAALVIDRLRIDIAREMVGLRARVLEMLRDRSLNLPSVVRCVGLLRRMREEQPMGRDDGGLEESELRLILLVSRWDCLRTQLEQLQTGSFGVTASDASEGASEDRVRYVKRWIELWREVVGDAAGMYVDIFLADGDSLSGREPLQIFLHHALSKLFELLEGHLPHVRPVSSLSSILTQLSYCSTAFARWGFDFRWRVGHVITRRVGDIVVSRWEEADRAFKAELAPKQVRLEDWFLAPDSKSKILSAKHPTLPQLSSNLAEATSLPKSFAEAQPPKSIGAISSHLPPQYLTLFPPLARLVNAHASALNELRLLPATVLWTRLRDSQSQTLARSAESLMALAETAQGGPEAPLISTALTWFARALVPWCERSLRFGIFGIQGEESDVLAGLRVRCEEVIERLV